MEVWDFVQEDLIVDDVMILDSGAELYVWIGKGANEDEVKKSMDLAKVSPSIFVFSLARMKLDTYQCVVPFSNLTLAEIN